MRSVSRVTEEIRFRPLRAAPGDPRDGGRAEWQKRIERWRDSGLSAEQFAAELGINAGTLKYWKYRLGKEARGSVVEEPKRGPGKAPRAASLVEVHAHTATLVASSFEVSRVKCMSVRHPRGSYRVTGE